MTNSDAKLNSGRQFAACAARCGSRHSAAVMLEFIVALPILVIAFLACFTYGSIMTVQHAVMAAVPEGAREGAKVPTTLGAVDGVRVSDAVQATVATVLGPHGFTVSATSGVQIVVEDSSGVTCLGQPIGACPAVTSVTDPAEVRVTVRVEFDNARVPNLLATFGVDFTGKYFELVSLSRRDV